MKLLICVIWYLARLVVGEVLVAGDNFVNIYNPSDVTSWYINDHTFIAGPSGTWHMLGITHSDPAAPLYEVNFAHAVSSNLTFGWQKLPFATGSVLPETHMWAPHIILVNSTYYMFYCGGGDSDTSYQINLRTSPDMYTWTFVGTLFTDGWDGRDPMVMNLGDAFGGLWVMYYCATSPNSGSGDVHHVTYARTSTDLVHWSDSRMIFDAGSTGGASGGPTESPFVVRRGKSFYLFSGSWASYSDTRVFLSTDPFDFGSTTNGTAQQVGEILSHAPEVTRDFDGTWYISRAGWGQGGLFLSPLIWSDGLDSEDTSMPPPEMLPPIAPNFNTTLNGWNSLNGEWVETPEGLQGGYVYGDAFYTSSVTASNFTCEGDLMLITKDGNPNSPPDTWTRLGSSASLVFRASDAMNPGVGAYVVNVHTDLGGGIKLFKFPYQEIQGYAFNIQQYVTYHLKVQASGSNFIVWFNAEGETPAVVIKASDSDFTTGFLGVNIWQGAALFQNVVCKSN